MVTQSSWNAHQHLAWAMWGLDEIEATLASFRSSRHKRTARTEAESAMADMHTARDTFRKSIEEPAQMDDVARALWKADLEREWAAFEDSLQTYLQTVGEQVAEQETVFRARADAQSRAWQHAIAKLHERAANFAADRRGDIEAAVRRLEFEADASRAKLEMLNTAEGASWVAMKSALSETRAALDRAHEAVHDAFEHSA
jgi:hypothetical protein